MNELQVPLFPISATEAIAAEVDRLLAPGLQRLGFPPEMEVQFERDCGAERARRLWREGLISIITFNLFYFGEWLLTHQTSSRDLLVQGLLVTPLALLVNLLMRFHPARRLREGSVTLLTCIVALTYLYLQLGKGPVDITFTLVAIIVTAMFAAVVMRLRFFFSLFASSVIGVAGLAFLMLDHALRTDEKITGAALMSIAIGTAVLSNYSLEREERIGYLRYLESESQRLQVRQANFELAKLSTIDTLTNLPNRRAYEDRFDRLWAEAQRDKTVFSAIVIDVDHFKVLNDVRGHIYGDEVLRRIGSLLPQTLRSTEDFAARYGGEEFVVLLPRTDQESAERVAERIRALIEMAGSPSQPSLPETECLMWVTASCGVGTCRHASKASKEVLLGSADRAMYRAKAEGSNRVCFRDVEEIDVRDDLRIAVVGFVA